MRLRRLLTILILGLGVEVWVGSGRIPPAGSNQIGATAALGQSADRANDLKLPNQPDSVKFAAIGDNGTGDRAQYDVARQMVEWHARFSYDTVIMLGDNMYGRQEP